jgi:hypothetical protein
LRNCILLCIYGAIKTHYEYAFSMKKMIIQLLCILDKQVEHYMRWLFFKTWCNRISPSIHFNVNQWRTSRVSCLITIIFSDIIVNIAFQKVCVKCIKYKIYVMLEQVCSIAAQKFYFWPTSWCCMFPGASLSSNEIVKPMLRSNGIYW